MLDLKLVDFIEDQHVSLWRLFLIPLATRLIKLG